MPTSAAPRASSSRARRARRSGPRCILKDLIEGAKAAAAIADNKEWKETRPAQVSIKETELVAEVRKILARHGG